MFREGSQKNIEAKYGLVQSRHFCAGPLLLLSDFDIRMASWVEVYARNIYILHNLHWSAVKLSYLQLGLSYLLIMWTFLLLSGTAYL